MTMPELGEALTVGEVEVLAMAAKGMTNKRIGVRIGVSEDSVSWSMRRIQAKLGASDRASAVDRGWRVGYLGMWQAGMDWSTSRAQRLVSSVADSLR